MNQRFNRTKVIATIGPASSSKEVLSELVEAGVDVFRFNFSHGNYNDYLRILNYIEDVNNELKTRVTILADLQGPKIRVGEIADGKIKLEPGQELILTTKECKGTKSKVSISYSKFPKDVKEGERVLLDDGKLELEILHTNKRDEVKTKVIYGGSLRPRKGVNLPNTKISLPCLTEKDLKDLDFALKNNFDWIALSFVRFASDIEELKKVIADHGSDSKVIAKIEKPAAIDEIEKIIDIADAIMIARGDLGVEMNIEDLPLIQKHIVTICILSSKPVIIATQIMESMMKNPSPTRAEVTDVFTVVSEGADALMLSGETSVGKYPVRVIETIERILENVEKDDSNFLDYEGANKWNHLPRSNSKTFLSDTICYNACTLAEKVGARAIISMTNSGYTAYRISSFRPRAKIFIFTSNRKLLTALSLVWGVRAFYYVREISTDNTIKDVQQILKDQGYVEKGDIVVNTASMPIKAKMKTNTLKVSVIP